MRLKNLTALTLLALSTLSGRCVVHADQNPAYNGVPGMNAYGKHGVAGNGSSGHVGEGLYDGGKGGKGGDGYGGAVGGDGGIGPLRGSGLLDGDGGAGGDAYIGKDR